MLLHIITKCFAIWLLMQNYDDRSWNDHYSLFGIEWKKDTQ